MKALVRSALAAAVIALPTMAFAQSQPLPQIDEMQVETIAYEVVGTDVMLPPVRVNGASEKAGSHPGASASDAALSNPAYDVGLKSIYTRH